MFDQSFAQQISKEELKSLLNALLNHTLENVVIVSPDHKILAFNQTLNNFWVNILGKHMQIGDDYRDYVRGETKEKYLEFVANALKGEIVQATVSNLNMTYDFTVTPIYASGKTVGVLLISRNQTEYIRQQQQINKNELVLKTILNNTDNGIILFDLNHHITAFNHTAQRLFSEINGNTLEVGARYKDFLPQKNLERYTNVYDKALEGKTIEFEYYTESYRASKWMRYKTGPIYDDNNKIIGISWAITDIDERKRLELKLENSEARFRNIVEAAPTAMLIVNSKMEVVQVNKEFENLFGYNRGELIGLHLHTLIPNRFHDAHKEHQHKYQQKPVPYRMGSGRFTPAKRKDGEEIVVEISLNSFEEENERFVMAIIQDVSLRIKHEQQINSQIERLKEIAWHQSHMVRQPLSNLLGLMNILNMDPNQSQEEFGQIKGMLLTSAQNLDEAVKDIVKRAQTNEL